MAVTSRELHRQSPRYVASASAWKPWPVLVAPYVRIVVALLIGYMSLALLTGWGRIWIDNLRYGRPRTQHLAGNVGHNEGSGEPTHFIAMNLNRRIVVIELPGGDSSKAQILQGPYLFGANEDLTPVGLRLQDINGDGKNDLIVTVKREEIIYINSGENFRLINADERKHLQKAP